MASSLTAQLSQIAAKSTHQLDLNAQKASHAQSLIFEKSIAGSQTFDTVYHICHEGFLELCALDSRFKQFQHTIFSEQSKTEERAQLSKSQNEALDRVLEDFLALVGARLLLTPAVKAVDWLIRRFRIHEFNTAFVLLTFLPYHTTPLFMNLLSLVPENLPPALKALYPYRRSLTTPSRQPLVHSATTNRHFFTALNNYVLHVAKANLAYSGLLSFWAALTTEAVAGMLDAARSGRIEVESRNKEDVLLRVLPILQTGFSVKSNSELTVSCYMITVVLAAKGNLSDKVLAGLMETVADSWTTETFATGLTCLKVLARNQSHRELPPSVIKSLARSETPVNLDEIFEDHHANQNSEMTIPEEDIEMDGIDRSQKQGLGIADAVDEDSDEKTTKEERRFLKSLDKTIASLEKGKPKDPAESIFTAVNLVSASPRPVFSRATLKRVSQLWTFLKDRETTVAGSLFQTALDSAVEKRDLADSARDALFTVRLSGAVLVNLLQTISSSVGEMDNHSPATKRRRTSQNNMVAMSLRDPKETRLLMDKMTLVLELIDSSKPEKHPQLLGGLFKVLASLHHLKVQSQSEMSYLFTLVLGIMLSIISKLAENPNANIDTSITRADLVVDCVRTSESPQVQNTALLLVAGLSAIAPEIILHSVMPIFTFMGSSVLKKDDEYSALVIDRTIDQVVPSLVQSLRSQKRDIVSGTSELLLSFTAAFEHIPPHRRLRLFEALVSKLGPEDFLFAVLSMLANKYPNDRDVLNVMTSLASQFTTELQLSTYSKYLGLAHDTLQPKPTLSHTLLGVGGEDGGDPNKVAGNILSALANLIKRALAPKLAETLKQDSGDNDNVNDLYARILEQTLALSTGVPPTSPLGKAVGDVLGAILGSLSLVDFIETIEVLMQREDSQLRRQVLSLLEARLDSSHENDPASRTRVLTFLSSLVDILKDSETSLKHISVACISHIVVKYGKKDTGKVVSTVSVVAQAACDDQTDEKLCVLGVRCLASTVEVLDQAFIPILPLAVPRCLGLLEHSMVNKQLPVHDAVYAFLAAVLRHVPFMISGEYLKKILLLSFESARVDLSKQSSGARKETLDLLATNLNIEVTAEAVEANWSPAFSAGALAADELLNIVGTSIEKHPRKSTMKNVAVLTRVLQLGLDIRRTQGKSENFRESDLNKLEGQVCDIAIKMVYQLNDTTFRPLFIKLADWASMDLPKTDESGRMLRLTSFFKFAGEYFVTLKSIVTSYSTFIIDSTVDVLNLVRCDNKSTRQLWTRTMTMLRSSFEYDTDEYWQSPSRFNAILSPLVSQLSQSTNNSTYQLILANVIPTIVGLAVAADSPDNNKDLNSLIMGFMRARGAENPFTRLAAVRCEQALTQKLGEEWLALLPEMLPYISELMEDDDENVEKETRRWVLAIEDVLGEKLDDMLT